MEGDLEPISNCPLEIIYLNSYKGELTALSKSNIQLIKISMYSDNGDLRPLNLCKIQELYFNSYQSKFEGDLMTLINSPLKILFMDNFNGDITLLS